MDKHRLARLRLWLGAVCRCKHKHTPQCQLQRARREIYKHARELIEEAEELNALKAKHGL